MQISFTPMFRLIILLLSILGPEITEGEFIIRETNGTVLFAEFSNESSGEEEFYQSVTTITVRDKSGKKTILSYSFVDNGYYEIRYGNSEPQYVDMIYIFMDLRWDEFLYYPQAAPVSEHDAIIITPGAENMIFYSTENGMQLEFPYSEFAEAKGGGSL